LKVIKVMTGDTISGVWHVLSTHTRIRINFYKLNAKCIYIFYICMLQYLPTCMLCNRQTCKTLNAFSGQLKMGNLYQDFITVNWLHYAEPLLRSRQLCNYLRIPRIFFFGIRNFMHKSPQLVPILSQIYPVRTTPSLVSKTLCNIIHPLTSWSS
jgi:hypothetical protein